MIRYSRLLENDIFFLKRSISLFASSIIMKITASRNYREHIWVTVLNAAGCSNPNIVPCNSASHCDTQITCLHRRRNAKPAGIEDKEHDKEEVCDRIPPRARVEEET